MKRILLICSLLLCASVLYAQKNIKVYAYKQPVAGGVPNEVIMEGGSQKNQVPARQRYNFWIYFMHAPASKISITGLFLNGQWYNVKTSAVSQTPVAFVNQQIPDSKDSVVLVPATRNTVWFIEPNGLQKTTKRSGRLKKIMKENEIIVAYRWRGGSYYAASKNMKTLTPAVMQ